MKYFLDTEFAESPGQLDLISLGLVAEDGRELYIILTDGWSEDRCSDWVKEHVLKTLDNAEGQRLTRTEAVVAIKAFIGSDPTPVFWAWYAAYDWVVFCWLFGAMIALPKNFPYYCRDLKQECDRIGLLGPLPHRNSSHNALADARDLAQNYTYVQEIVKRRETEAKADVAAKAVTAVTNFLKL